MWALRRISNKLFEKKAKAFFAVTTVTASAYAVRSFSPFFATSASEEKITGINEPFESAPKREDTLKRLQSGEEFDMLVIGGGATGTGIALDAATRGLKVALIERDDFGSGTSSRSTKLIHGGVRYLEKAFKKFDLGALSLVFDALQERSIFLKMAPHLTDALPIMTPCYKTWEVPYYWAGLKIYDILAGNQKLYWSRWLGKNESLRQFPMLAKQNLKGTVVYYDGQMDDSRMNVSLALTAAVNGAAVINHVEALSLLKTKALPEATVSKRKSAAEADYRISGARVKDQITGQEWDIKAKVVVNATGPYSDWIRQMEDPNVENIILPSSGVHVVLPDYYSPNNTGLIVPKTKDGRVVFMLPWQGETIAGTTDSSTKITYFPHPHESEIMFILDALSDYLNVKVRRTDVRAAWSGIRPLAKDPNATSTASASRDHIIEVSPGKLVTIAGGKWTTFRKMAKDTVDKAIQVGNLKPTGPCITHTLQVVGGKNWDRAFFTVITQDYKRLKTSKRKGYEKGLVRIPSTIAQHLSKSYGTRALRVAQLAQDGYGNRLVDGYPYLEAEVVFAAQEEYAVTAVDVIARRLRLAFLDAEASQQCLPRIVDILGEVLKWDQKKKEQELKDAKYFLHIMNVGRRDEYNDEPELINSGNNK